MLASFAEKLYRPLVNVKNGRPLLSSAERDQILYNAKRIRSKDYYLTATILEDGQIDVETVTTTANWYFVLTAVRFGGDYSFLTNPETPFVGIKFENFYPSTCLNGPRDLREIIPARFMSVGTVEGKFRYEEFTNLFYMLGERVTISAVFNKDNLGQEPDKSTKLEFIFTGLEFNFQGD
ncbi:MAG: hypothetical protein J5594_05695 [Elusimicrobiaceae bacterium]|nr:hypothetical protein [Elusimicrobiaceae bacterium]MBR4151745.1 hypothetical protein [Selenomonadaceae bacterium]